MDSASVSKTSGVRGWQELERRPRFLVWANGSCDESAVGQRV